MYVHATIIAIHIAAFLSILWELFYEVLESYVCKVEKQNTARKQPTYYSITS